MYVQPNGNKGFLTDLREGVEIEILPYKIKKKKFHWGGVELDPPLIAIEFISLNHEVKEVGRGKVVCSGR